LPAEERLFTADKHESQTRVEDLARLYIEAIKRQFPKGPYVLAGVSFGGVLAYEMARQLEASGVEVPLLALIDSILPSSVTLNPRKWLSEKTKILQEKGLRGLVSRTGDRVRALINPPPTMVSEPDLDDMRLSSYSKAARRYEHGKNTYGGRTLLIRAENLSFVGCDIDPMLGWATRLTGEVLVSSSSGDHLGVLREQRTADLMRRALDWVRAYRTRSVESLLPPPPSFLASYGSPSSVPPPSAPSAAAPSVAPPSFPPQLS